MEQISVTTWEEFKERLDDLRQKHDESLGALLYRGQESSCWPLRTTLDRRRELMPFSDYYRIIHRVKPQIESLTNSEWIIPEYPEVEQQSKGYDFFDLLWSGRSPGYAYMTYLRHHAFPSPLLDWSRSPFVAAFFAFNRAADESGGKVSIFVFSEVPNRLSGNGIPFVKRMGPYVKTHRRHFLQHSEYTLCLMFQNEWHFERYDKVFDDGRHQQGACWKFNIPAVDRRKVMKELATYNLNALSLFGSEESMMETLATREFCLGTEKFQPRFV